MSDYRPSQKEWIDMRRQNAKLREENAHLKGVLRTINQLLKPYWSTPKPPSEQRQSTNS